MPDDAEDDQAPPQTTTASPAHSLRSVATLDGTTGSPQHNTYASRVVLDPMDNNNTILAITDTADCPVKPTVFRSRKRRDSFSVGSDISVVSDSPSKTMVLDAPIELLPMSPKMMGGLPEEAWKVILGMLVDEEGILSRRQRQAVLEYSRSRRTLHEEAGSRGKADSVQTWRVLEAMGCLSYDEVL